MPGIAGIVSSLDRVSIQEILSNMGKTLLCPQECSPRVWSGEQAGIITVGSDSGEMLAVDRAGQGAPEIVLGVVGQIAPDDRFRERWGKIPNGDNRWGLASRLLAIYKRFGASGLQGLNGAYVIVVWESTPFRMTLISDRGGMQPFYYWLNGQELLFASRLQAISRMPRFHRQVNTVALFDLLAAEQMLDERTLFNDIQALPPAAHLTYENGQLQIKSYWQPRLYAAGDRVPTEAKAIDELAGHVLSAVNLFLNEVTPWQGACLLLTGGLDSRLLAGSLACKKGDIPIMANTIGHERARDVRYGRQIARATGLPYTVLPSNPNYLADDAAEFVRRTEGGSNVHASWILGEVSYLTQARVSAIFTGVGAEAVSGRHWLSDQPVSTRREALNRLCEARWTYSRAAALLRPQIRDEACQSSRESLWRTLQEAPSDHLLGWSDYFAYRQNRRHPTGSVLSDNALVLEPYFENALVDYAYGLPPELRNKGMLYKRMIIQRFPEVAGIGYTDSGIRLADEFKGSSTVNNLASKVQDFSRRAVNRLGRTIPMFRRGPFGDRPAQAIYYNHWLRTAARPFVTNLLAREDLYADFLDVRQVHRIVEDHMSGRTDEFRLINAVVTFALWREQFDRA